MLVLEVVLYQRCRKPQRAMTRLFAARRAPRCSVSVSGSRRWRFQSSLWPRPWSPFVQLARGNGFFVVLAVSGKAAVRVRADGDFRRSRQLPIKALIGCLRHLSLSATREVSFIIPVPIMSLLARIPRRRAALALVVGGSVTAFVMSQAFSAFYRAEEKDSSGVRPSEAQSAALRRLRMFRVR
jgi:hypothetical protein